MHLDEGLQRGISLLERISNSKHKLTLFGEIKVIAKILEILMMIFEGPNLLNSNDTPFGVICEFIWFFEYVNSYFLSFFV